MLGRKAVFILIAVMVCSGSTALLAQVPHFIVSGTSYQVRLHGQTELLGDLTLTCDVAGTFPNPSAITVVYTPVYSLVNSTGGLFSVASAQPFNARTAYAESEPATTGIVVGVAQYNATVRNSISIPVSGTAAVNDIIRVAGIRANIAEANLVINQSVVAYVTASPSNAFQIDNVNNVSVAFVLDEMQVSVDSTQPMIICEPTVSHTGNINITEKFPSALTSLTDENGLQRTPATGKQAAHGSQIIITLANIMPGVTASWPTTVTNGSLSVGLPSGALTSFFNSSTTDLATSIVVYDVIADSQTVNESISIPITFTPTAIPIPAVYGTITAQVVLGPNAGLLLTGDLPSSSLLSFVRNPQNNPPDGIIALTGVQCASNLMIQNFLLVPTSAPAGSTATLMFDIHNQGAGTAAASTTNIYFNTSPTTVGSSDLLVASLNTPMLPPNGTVSVNQSFQIPCNLPLGTYYVWISLDVGRTANQSIFSDDKTNAPLTTTLPTCALPSLQSSQSFVASGGTGSINIAAPLGCSWAARSNVPWLLVLSPPNNTSNGTVSYSVAVNSSPTARSGTMTIAGSTFVVVQAGTSTTGLSAILPPAGGVSKVSLNQGGLSVLYGQITGNTASQPAALTNFGLTQNGALITEVGVAAAPLVTFTRLFVDLSGGFDSGVALVNPNEFPITISLEAQDSNGQRAKRSGNALVPQAILTLPPHAHLARFVSQLGLNLPPNFLGTLTLSSCSPFAAVNLRSATNGHSETIFTALPLADLNHPPAGSNLIFPQVVDGGGLPTQILLMNPSANTAAVGTIALLGDSGTALALDFGSGPQSILNYSIPPNGMVKYTTTGNGSLRAGYAVVTPSSGPPPIGSSIFTSRGGNGTASQAGVPNAPTTTAARLFVDVATSPLVRNTGVAIVNPNAASATVNLSLLGSDGRVFSGTLTIPANGHVAKFINELLPTVPAGYQGILTLTSNVNIAAVTLRLTKNQRGEDIYSTLPVSDLNNPPMGVQILPQLVDGGGFQTQLILMNTTNNAGTVQVDFFNDNGFSTPLILQ